MEAVDLKLHKIVAGPALFNKVNTYFNIVPHQGLTVFSHPEIKEIINRYDTKSVLHHVYAIHVTPVNPFGQQ